MFQEPLKMKNAIQPYAWGSVTAIAELLGRPAPGNQPEAELWMGAHPKAPSQVWYQARWQNLDELIRKDPLPILGRIAVDHFGPQLPFLFKVLAVQQPLSIQAHPDKAAAEQGFARENEHGIALTAPNRNYRDVQHKPECVCALTRFTALCGFRDTAAILDLLRPIWPAHRKNDLDPLSLKNQVAGLRNFFSHMMKLSKDLQQELVGDLVSAANRSRSAPPSYQWMVRLNTAYPGDIGVLSPCYLHLVTLEAGQALFLKAGRLHAYLKGVAIEVMANSDNVLRGGLTPKHVDVDQLLNVVEFRPEPLEILMPDPTGPAIKRYPSFADEFELETMDIRPSNQYDSGPRVEAPEIVLCLEGQVKMHWGGNGYGMSLERGESVIVPAQFERYRLVGHGKLYKAGVHHRLFGQQS